MRRTNTKLMTTILLLFFGIMAMAVLAYGFARWKRHRDDAINYFDVEYSRLVLLIDQAAITQYNYEVLSRDLVRLRSMKHCNREKVDNMETNFKIDFDKYSKFDEPKLTVHEQVESINQKRF